MSHPRTQLSRKSWEVEEFCPSATLLVALGAWLPRNASAPVEMPRSHIYPLCTRGAPVKSSNSLHSQLRPLTVVDFLPNPCFQAPKAFLEFQPFSWKQPWQLSSQQRGLTKVP